MKKQRKRSLLFLFLFVFFLTACGSKSKMEFGQNYYTGANKTTDEEGTEKKDAQIQEEGNPNLEELYLVIKNDMASEYLILEQLSTEKQYLYHYSLGTIFKNKYDAQMAETELTAGKIVSIGGKNPDGKLISVQVSEEAWEYEGIVRYSVDTEREILKIADTNYACAADVPVVSGEAYISLEDLTGQEELRVVGIGKKIYSITVMTGMGTLALENTALFDGSYIQIGTKIFAKIMGNMEIELEEGTYTVAVAKDGYGGTTEITVERNQVVNLNLDELKGEGPKYGAVLFAIPVEGAVLSIDGNPVDYSQVISLKYGVHVLTVEASGYDTWSKKLYVNSPEATIVIDPTEKEEKVESADTKEETEEQEEAKKSQNEEKQEETEPSEDATESYDTDYLTTLTELISALT